MSRSADSCAAPSPVNATRPVTSSSFAVQTDVKLDSLAAKLTPAVAVTITYWKPCQVKDGWNGCDVVVPWAGAAVPRRCSWQPAYVYKVPDEDAQLQRMPRKTG